MHPKPKKYFGQHFLKEKSIASKIADSLLHYGSIYSDVVEVGPGTGVLTFFLQERFGESLNLIEIDEDLIDDLGVKFPTLKNNIHNVDFLETDFASVTKNAFGLIGNFPYNISSQIIFKALENRKQIPEIVGMFQREVAQRVCATPGNKVYGLISVWVQTFYETEYLFTVSEGCFNPPPKVKSGVIRLTRKEKLPEDFDAALHLRIIKTAFNQRRKILRNSLAVFRDKFALITDPAVFEKRPEQLSWEDFLCITKTFGTI